MNFNSIVFFDKAKLIAVIVMLAGVFVFDLCTPLGIADGMLYVIVVTLTIGLEKKIYTHAVAAAAIILLALGYYFSPAAYLDFYIAPVNRILSGVCIVASAVITIKYKTMEALLKKQFDELKQLAGQLKISNADLEEHVKARTKTLEDTLRELELSKKELSNSLAHEKELNELKSRIITMASHEFRTPLAIIQSSITLITKYAENGDKENQLKHIHKIKTVINQLTDLIEETLSLNRLDEKKIKLNAEKINVPVFISEVIKEFPKYDKTVNYRHSGVDEILCDKNSLKEILLVLTSNAMKFSNGSPEVKISSHATPEHFMLEVEDKGIGISEKDQVHLFERFFRGENALNIQGTGLGLYIVARYIELLRGSVDVKSLLDKGSVFTVKIPLQAV
jgi:signal transduction histidine kinase